MSVRSWHAPLFKPSSGSLLTPIKAKACYALADLVLWDLWCTLDLFLSLCFPTMSSDTHPIVVPWTHSVHFHLRALGLTSAWNALTQILVTTRSTPSCPHPLSKHALLFSIPIHTLWHYSIAFSGLLVVCLPQLECKLHAGRAFVFFTGVLLWKQFLAS